MKDVIVGIDAGTSVIKSVAFTLSGEQIAECARPNSYATLPNGGVEQDPHRTWQDTAETIKGLGELVPDLSQRLAAISVTGQGDGTWLIDSAGEPVGSGWLWLDARAGSLVEDFQNGPHLRSRFELTGTGFAACQQSAHMMWMKRNAPELLAKSTTAFHCKDWLYMKLTGERVTDPSEGCFTFGNFRTREYADEILDFMDLADCAHLLPPMLDGVREHHELSDEAAGQTGLIAGTPVVLGYVDVLCTALGAGLYDNVSNPGCTIVGSTGIHMKLVRGAEQVVLGSECTGFTMPMPLDGVYAQMQSNLASTLNIDWLLDIAVDLLAELGTEKSRRELLPHIDKWLADSNSAEVLYQPYILEAGERGPIIDSNARAGFIGLNSRHRFADLMRGVVEGLAFASRDCYSAMGSVPEEIRLTGGAARSDSLRAVFADVLGSTIRTCQREEAGAAGAAMIAAVSIGQYQTIDECVQDWVSPWLGKAENPEPENSKKYAALFPGYLASRKAIRPVWKQMADARNA
ncbi:MAG: carbohydrate kinase [Granulosicoccus sp.]|nr:carbohydrate kinase [Granulosicoccus sp.]